MSGLAYVLDQSAMSACGSFSDLTAAKSDFCFTPDNGHAATTGQCPKGAVRDILQSRVGHISHSSCRRWHRGPYPHPIVGVF